MPVFDYSSYLLGFVGNVNQLAKFSHKTLFDKLFAYSAAGVPGRIIQFVLYLLMGQRFRADRKLFKIPNVFPNRNSHQLFLLICSW
jgi:hypothetical protein